MDFLIIRYSNLLRLAPAAAVSHAAGVNLADSTPGRPNWPPLEAVFGPGPTMLISLDRQDVAVCFLVFILS